MPHTAVIIAFVHPGIPPSPHSTSAQSHTAGLKHSIYLFPLSMLKNHHGHLGQTTKGRVLKSTMNTPI